MENTDYKQRYEALVKDIREGAVCDICAICVGSNTENLADCECGCAACKAECRMQGGMPLSRLRERQ